MIISFIIPLWILWLFKLSSNFQLEYVLFFRVFVFEIYNLEREIFFFKFGLRLRFFNCFLKAYSVGSIEKILKLLIFLSIKFLAKLKDLSPIFEPISII